MVYILAKRYWIRTASIIIGLVVIIGSAAGGLVMWLSEYSTPDGVFIEYPYSQQYLSTNPWIPPNGSFALIFIDAKAYNNSVEFRETVWNNFLELIRKEEIPNLYVVRVTCTEFLRCREETARVTMNFYEFLFYQVSGGKLAYPPSLIVVYNNNSRIDFVDSIILEHTCLTDPFKLLDELKDAMSQYIHQRLQQS